MNIKSYSLLFAVAAFLATQPAYAADKPSDLNNMLDSLSNMLSSTNPKQATIEPGAGDVADDIPVDDTRQRIAKLPPLVKPVHAGVSQASVQTAPPPAQIIQPQVDYERLSPQTKRILEATPSGIGSGNSAHGNFAMERGDFDPEYGKYINEPIDKGEKPEAASKADKVPPAVKDGKAPVAAAATPAPKPGKMDINVGSGNRSSEASIISDLDGALRALNGGQYEIATALYKSALQKDSRNRDAMFGLATSYHKAGQKAQARDAYARLLSAYPAYEPGLNNMLVLASSEAPEDALKELNQIGARNPNFAPVYAQKGSIYAKTGDFTNARDNLVKALKIDPNNINYRYNLAILLDKNGDTVNAARLYNQVLNQNSQGAKLPVDRNQIEERLAFIGALKSSRS